MPATTADSDDPSRPDDGGPPRPPAGTATHDLAELWQDTGGSD
jgi:hypothetical protein